MFYYALGEPIRLAHSEQGVDTNRFVQRNLKRSQFRTSKLASVAGNPGSIKEHLAADWSLLAEHGEQHLFATKKEG